MHKQCIFDWLPIVFFPSPHLGKTSLYSYNCRAASLDSRTSSRQRVQPAAISPVHACFSNEPGPIPWRRSAGADHQMQQFTFRGAGAKEGIANQPPLLASATQPWPFSALNSASTWLPFQGAAMAPCSISTMTSRSLARIGANLRPCVLQRKPSTRPTYWYNFPIHCRTSRRSQPG